MNTQSVTKYLVVLSVLCLLPVATLGEVNEFDIHGFTITSTVTVPGSTLDAFDTMTGDIKPWWDHSVSEHPAELRIDPFAGGQFYEVMPDDRGTVEHAQVIYAERGVELRLHGPFGLSGRAVDMVTSITYEANEDDSTVVNVSVNIVGQINQDVADLVNNVWDHFLQERLKPYMEGTLEE